MISFSGCNNLNFTGIKLPKFNTVSMMPKIMEKLPADIFYKKQSIPQSLAEDGISERTFNKAKKFVMKSVKDLYPKESMVIINNGKIEEAAICGAHSGNMTARARRLADSPYNNVVLIHSHPKTGADTTCPPSLGDWATLNKYPGMKSMYVISADGEYTILRKIDRAGLSKKAAMDEENRFMFLYANYVDQMDIKACKEFARLFNWGTELVSMGVSPSALSDKFEKLSKNIDHAGLTTEFVHNFWKKYGDKLNVSYETNLNGLH